jgi:hypothetical protein
MAEDPDDTTHIDESSLAGVTFGSGEATAAVPEGCSQGAGTQLGLSESDDVPTMPEVPLEAVSPPPEPPPDVASADDIAAPPAPFEPPPDPTAPEPA